MKKNKAPAPKKAAVATKPVKKSADKAKPGAKAVAPPASKAKKSAAKPAAKGKAAAKAVADVPPAAQPVAADAVVTMEQSCNICGSNGFKAGPNGRLAPNGRPPFCAGCGAAERHRAYRVISDNIRSGSNFKSFKAVSFSKDRSFAGGWFSSMRQAADGADFLDVQNISLGDESVDVAICNGVLAAVPHYDKALKEIARVLSKKGFAFISFPNPHYRKVTQDWGVARQDQHGMYRTFGEDIEGKLCDILPALGIVRVVAEDPVTGYEDRAYVISKNSDFLAGLGERGLRIRFLQF